MVKRPFLAAFCFFVALSLPLHAGAAPWAVDRTELVDAAADGGGRIWGLTNQEGLLRWQGDRWRPEPFAEVRGWQGAVIRPAPDGSAVSLWTKDGHSLLARQGVNGSRVLALFDHEVPSPQLLPTPDGGVWITGATGDIRRWRPGAGVSVVKTLPDSLYAPSNNAATADRNEKETLRATPVGGGRVWFWSSYASGSRDCVGLRGVVVWDGTAFVTHPRLPGLPVKSVNFFAPQDAGHVWLGLRNGGLWRVDTRTMAGQRVLPPAPKMLLNVFRAIPFPGGDWLFVDRPDVFMPRSDVLWRLHRGVCRRVVSGVDMGVEWGMIPDRPARAVPGGLWLGAFGGGAWWVPAGPEAARPVDWRCGFPLAQVHRLFPLPGGRTLAVRLQYEGAGSAILPPQPPRPLAPPLLSLRTVLMTSEPDYLLADGRHHLWGVRDPNTALSEWDGRRWITHPFGHASLETSDTLALDSRGRVWYYGPEPKNPASLFDQTTRTWTSFKTEWLALQAQANTPRFWLRGDNGAHPARFGPSGRVVLLADWRAIKLWDGHAWRAWTTSEITGVKNGPNLDCPPFFNRAGRPCVNIDRRTWEWDAANGWRTIPSEASPENGVAPPWKDVPSSLAPVSARTRDDMGTPWIVRGVQLYRCAFGLARPQFAPGASSPFTDGRGLTGALVDPQGSVFLATSGGGFSEYLILPATSPRPRILSMPAAAPDSVTFSLATDAPGPVLFAWRLDGGPWSTPGRASRVHWDLLPAGHHRFDVQALDARLQSGRAQYAFAIHVDPAAQVARLVGLLVSGDDDQRERAVSALQRQPARARPALGAARSRVGEAARWWIDAALQGMEN